MYNTVQTDSELEETSNSPSDQSKKTGDKVGVNYQRVLNVFRGPGFLVVVVWFGAFPLPVS